jgi:hypothetical protein
MCKYLLLVVMCVACLSVACMSDKLPPHVWMPVKHVEGVDFFWWTDMQICQVRVIYWVGPDDIRGQTMTVDPAVCLDRLKADGYKVPTK